MIQTALTIGAAAVINRFRGGGFWADKLPGRPLLYVAPIMGALELTTVGGTKWSALIVALGYLVWGLPAWGQWYDFNHIDDYRPPARWEEWVNRITSDNDGLAFFVRQALVLPCFIALAVLLHSWSPLLVGAMLVATITSAYAMAWFIHDWGWTKQPITVAELMTGAAWGIAIQLV